MASAGYQWTTIRAERREKYDEVIRKKLRIAPLHAVVRVGAVSPKLDEARAGEHPRICLSTEDLLLLDQAAGHLREEVERLVRGVAEEIDRLTEEHRATFQTIRSLEGELAKTSDRARRKELSARKADEQRANDVREKDLAALEKVKRGMNPRRVVTEALDRTVEALQLLVENDETPLEGRASAELDEAANAAGEAAAADGSTRASVVRAVGGWSFLRAWRLGDSVTLKLTELLESLPHARSTKKEDLLTTRGDIAKVTRLFVEVLRQAWEFAEAGESYNDAPDRLKLALALLEEHRDEVKSGQPSPERSARLEELARHPTLEEQVQLRFCEYLGLQPEKPNEGVAALLTPFADDDNVDVRPFE